MPHAHLLNRKAAALQSRKRRVFTLAVYNMQLRNIGKKQFALPIQQ